MLKADDYAVPAAKMWGWMSNPNVRQPKPVVETGRMGNPALKWLVDQLEASKRYQEHQQWLEEAKKDYEANHGLSRTECDKLGINRYRGKPCKKCGGVVRYVNNSTCTNCNQRRNRLKEAENREKRRLERQNAG